MATLQSAFVYSVYFCSRYQKGKFDLDDNPRRGRPKDMEDEELLKL